MRSIIDLSFISEVTMEAVLLSAVLSCADGAWILSGIRNTPLLESSERSDLRIEVIQMMPDNCSPEQYNPPGRK